MSYAQGSNQEDTSGSSHASVLKDVQTAAYRAAAWERERRGAGAAVDAIDAALRTLYRLRQQIVSEHAAHQKAMLDQYDAFDTYADNITAGTR